MKKVGWGLKSKNLPKRLVWIFSGTTHVKVIFCKITVALRFRWNTTSPLKLSDFHKYCSALTIWTQKVESGNLLSLFLVYLSYLNTTKGHKHHNPFISQHWNRIFYIDIPYIQLKDVSKGNVYHLIQQATSKLYAHLTTGNPIVVCETWYYLQIWTAVQDSVIYLEYVKIHGIYLMF